MFTQQDIAEADDRDILRNSASVGQESLRAADGHEVVDGLHGSGIAGFLEHLAASLGTIRYIAPRLKNELVVHVHATLAQGAPIPFEPFLGPGCVEWPGEKGDPFMAEFEQMLGGAEAGIEIIGFHVYELLTERGGVAQQDGGNRPREEFLVNGRFGAQAIYGRDE